MSTHNFEQLKAHILPLSKNQENFELARQEWRLVGFEVSEEWDQCPCGQDIKEHCHIENSLTTQKTYVGNVCINRFIGISTGNLFDGLKRIAEDDGANPNEDLIEHAYALGYLYGEKEYKFLMETRFKKKLSAAQLAWKRTINRRIIQRTVVRRRGDGSTA